MMTRELGQTGKCCLSKVPTVWGILGEKFKKKKKSLKGFWRRLQNPGTDRHEAENRTYKKKRLGAEESRHPITNE